MRFVSPTPLTLCSLSTYALQNDDTALTIACKQSEVAVVSLLLKAGANPNTCNKVVVEST